MMMKIIMFFLLLSNCFAAENKLMLIAAQDLIISQTGRNGKSDDIISKKHQQAFGLDYSRVFNNFFLSMRYERMYSRLSYYPWKSGITPIYYNSSYNQFSLGANLILSKTNSSNIYLLTRYGFGTLKVKSGKSSEKHNFPLQTISLGLGLNYLFSKSLTLTGEVSLRSTSMTGTPKFDGNQYNKYEFIERIVPNFLIGLGYMF